MILIRGKDGELFSASMHLKMTTGPCSFLRAHGGRVMIQRCGGDPCPVHLRVRPLRILDLDSLRGVEVEGFHRSTTSNRGQEGTEPARNTKECGLGLQKQVRELRPRQAEPFRKLSGQKWAFKIGLGAIGKTRARPISG